MDPITMEALCQISDSQEEHLRHCGFAGQAPKDAGGQLAKSQGSGLGGVSDEDGSVADSVTNVSPPLIPTSNTNTNANANANANANTNANTSASVDVNVDEMMQIDTNLNRVSGSGVAPQRTTSTTAAQYPTLMGLITLLSAQVDHDGEAEDILEVAKRAGMKIPRPRWWRKGDGASGLGK